MFRTVSMRVAIRELTSGISAEQTDRDEKTIPVTRIETVGDGFLHREKLGFVDPSSVPDRFLCRAGDIIYSNINSTPMIGRCAQVSEEDLPVAVGMNTLRIRPNLNRFDQRFFFWALYSEFMKAQARAWSKPAINQASLPQSSIKALKIPMPPLGDQQTIANYLDRETAEIDAFIADQERLIELLEERRAATITHAVTKGLDPNVPMKDTGLEWAPLIPRDWKINKISRAFRASKGQNAAALTHEYCASIPGQYPVYSGQTGNEGVMALINTYEFDAGDSGVLLTTTVGAKAMSVLYIQNRFSLSQNCMVISPVTNLVTGYYYYQFQALFEYEKGKISQHMQASFRMNDLYQYKFLQPPSHEEQQIADYLDREMAELDAAVSDAREAIALSQERRAALISAAVTGQMDVSQAQPPVDEMLEEEVRV